MARFSNPLAFTKGPVTFFTTVIYAGLIIALIIVHTTVPPIPSKLPNGVNITEAWLDLQHLTSFYHPYNSRANDYVRDWLLLRIQSILASNEVHASNKADPPSVPVFVFNDITSNLTSSSPGGVGGGPGISVYFEGTNIIVYIRGTEDDDAEWWRDEKGRPKGDYGGVLVNAHYDSVSTGYGATDDGMGVVSILQLIRYYTTSGNIPKKGLVALFNNGEEDFLNGARAFSQHPMSRFPSTFLNLEGAGAGGRAVLFRSTDAKVARAYKNSPYPFGSVVTGTGFESGLVRSQTDYVVFNGMLGMRGLDVAFFEPRSRYHTSQDDTRHTSQKSLWHMLSAAIATTKSLTSDTSDFQPSTGDQGAWFDLFGRAFGLMEKKTLLALSITLLVVPPVFILVTIFTLHRIDRLYLFSGSKMLHTPDGDEAVPLYGWRGFFRWPLVLAASCAAPVALGYVLSMENSHIVHSSEWAVWSMMFASFLVVAWVLSCAAEYFRPSALTRAYGFFWLSVGWWAILVADTVFETGLGMTGGYFVLFFYAGIASATWISLLDLFALPRKAKHSQEKGVNSSRRASQSSGQLLGGAHERSNDDDDGDAGGIGPEEVNERTGLLDSRRRGTFANYGHEVDNQAITETEEKHESPEQEWSSAIPRWTWLLQFMLVAPIVIITIGQIGLLIVSALHQTGQDGSSTLLVYMMMAAFSILLLSPLMPFLHRFTWHVPTLMLLVLVGTLIYNLTAFPFSSNNRLKLFFQQEVDIDSGINTVSLVGVSPYVQVAIRSIPSAAGQDIKCTPVVPGRTKCSWSGLPPHVVDSQSDLPPETQYRTWLSFNVSRSVRDATEASFILSGRNTRACKILFDSTISDVHVHGSGPDDKRFQSVPEGGSKEIRLWSRTWGTPWTVDVGWESQEDNNGTGIKGKVVCIWSDANHDGVIPALDEAKHYLPDWVAVTKFADGLVEGSKRFII